MHDYEWARDNLVKALTLSEDGGYIVWLGVTQLYLGVQYGSKMQRQANKNDASYKNMAVQRDKAFNECVKVLGSNYNVVYYSVG